MNPTDITELSLEEKEKFQEELDRGTSAQTATQTISAQSLSGSAPPLTIPPIVPSTTAEGLSGIAQVTAEQTKLAREQEIKAQEAQKGIGEEKGKLTGLMEKILGVQTSRTQLEEETKLGVKAQKVTDVTNQIEASQRAQTNEIRALESANITSDAKANAIAGINRKYAFEQADLALIQSAANRDLDTASRIIDRKIQLQLEPLQTQLYFTKFFYQENKELFTKAEDRAFNAKISKLEKQYQTEKENKTAIANIQLEALKNGVTIPQSVLTQLNTAKDASEATNILARNGINLADPLDRQIKKAQLAKLGAELEQTRLENIAKEVGTTSPYQLERQVRTLQSVEELRKRVNFQTVGIVGAIGKYAPASLPRNFRTDLDTLKATIAFGELTAMREASKTGGALGQVSNVELGLLESALGGLDQGQSPANFRKNLDKIEASIKRWQGAANAVSEEDQLRALGYTEEQIQQIKSAQ